MKREIDKGMDLNLCRPVAKGQPGDTVLWVKSSTPASIGDVGELLRVKNGEAAVDWNDANNLAINDVVNVVLAPICWVEGKPVYGSDELVHCAVGQVTVTGPHPQGHHGVSFMACFGYSCATVSDLSWPKTEFVLRLALFNDGNSRILDKGEPYPNEAEVRLISWEV